MEENFSGKAFDRLRSLFGDVLGLQSLRCTQCRIAFLSHLIPQKHDMCIDSCMAFTSEHIGLEKCLKCGEDRFTSENKPRQIYHTLLLTPRLLAQYRNAQRAKILYSTCTGSEPAYPKSSLFDGDLVQELCARLITIDGVPLESMRHCFANVQDLCIALLTDGFTLFWHKKSDIWPICTIVHNLPDKVQTRQENILILALIPGPSTPKDFDSFLNLIIEEFIELAHGIPAFDASTSKVFTMHAFPTTIFGDMLVICKVMRFNGSNGECPCWECLIIGVLLRRQHYFLHTMPSNHPLPIDPEPSDSDDMEGHVKFWLYERVPQTDDNYWADYDVLDLPL
jgi:hypothetical protein